MNSHIGGTSTLPAGKQLLTTTRLVTLVGPGGVGKSRVLRRLARELAGVYKHGVVVVQLGDLSGADDRLEAVIAEELGIAGDSATLALGRLVEHFRKREMLLMLDACEHLVGHDPGTGPVPRLVTTLLGAAPDLQVMTTSRVPLGVQGEYELVVPPLCVTADGRCEHDSDVPHEGQQLLIDRAAAVGISFEGDDIQGVDRLCRTLDGVPQAIERAASLLRAMTLEEMVEHPDLLHLLGLHPVIDRSYELLSDAERRAWILLSVFEGYFDREAAETVCGRLGVDARTVFGLLAGLVRKSLLVAEPREGRTRYRMLEIHRRYGLELVADSGEQPDLARAHANYFAQLVDRCIEEWFGPHEDEWMRRLQTRMPDIRAAQRYFASDPASARRGRELATKVVRTRSVVFSGALMEGRDMLALGVDGEGDVPSMEQVTVLSLHSWLALIQGNPAVGAPLLARAAMMAHQLGVSETCGPLLYARGTQRLLTEAEPAKARDALDLFFRAEQAFRAEGNPEDEYMAILFLGMTAAFVGGRDRAIAEAERVLAAARASEAPWCISWALWNAALTQLLHSDQDEAGQLAQEALERQDSMGDAWGTTWSFWLIAMIAATCGDHQRAARLLGAAQAGQRITGASVLGLLPFMRVQQRLEAATRKVLGDEDFNTEVAYGRKLGEQEFAIQVTPGQSRKARGAYDLALKPLPTRRRPTDQRLPHGLSQREFEVAGLVARGMTNREVGNTLNIAERTVETHMNHIIGKLRVSNRTEVAVWYQADATTGQ